jgi:O-antigen/teichoic acid export membrane protein
MYNLSLLPSLTSLASARDRQVALYHTSMAHVAAVGLPAAVGGWLLAGPIIELIFGASYAAAALPLGLLLWSLPLNLVRDVPLMGLISAGKERAVFRVTLISAGLNVALGLMLIPAYGVAGAAAGTLAAEAVRMVLALGFARAHGFPMPAVGRFAKVGLATGLMGVVIYALGTRSVWIGVPLGVGCYAAGLVLTGGLRLRLGRWPELTL